MEKKSRKSLIIAFILVAICLVVSVVMLIVVWGTGEKYKSTLENRYQKTYMQLIDNVDDIEVDLSKLVATTTYNSQKSIMQSIYTCCVMASENLGSLPLNNSSLSNVNKLVNRVGGYVYSMLQSDGVVEGDSLKNIEELHRLISVVKYDLNKGYSQSISDGLHLVDSSYNEEGSSFTAGLVVGEESYADLPTLIYDGPFSESVLNKEPKVVEDLITEYEAGKMVEKLSQYWHGYEIKYDGVTKGKLATYNFLLSGENDIFVQVLQNGGKLLSATSYGDYSGEEISIDEGLILAEQIAYDFGFDNMKSVWYQVIQDVLYVNLAPIEDGVIYYSDLVKIKIDLLGGDLLGFEGTNYIYNHYERGGYSASISMAEAQLSLSSSLKVLERNYCVVPNKWVGESDAYEFVCSWSNYTYYVYIDSNTGEELKVMRVIETDNGELLE